MVVCSCIRRAVSIGRMQHYTNSHVTWSLRRQRGNQKTQPKKGPPMTQSKTPSEAAAEAVTDEYYRLLGAGEREVQDAQHEGRYFELQNGFQRLIDEAFGTEEVVNACQLVIDDWDIATGPGGALEDVPDPPKIAACRKLLSKLKGTDDAH